MTNKTYKATALSAAFPTDVLVTLPGVGLRCGVLWLRNRPGTMGEDDGGRGGLEE